MAREDLCKVKEKMGDRNDMRVGVDPSWHVCLFLSPVKFSNTRNERI